MGFFEVNENQNLNNLSGEIELLKSKLFFDKVIKTLDLDVSYYSVGNILEDEQYRYPPFKVEYTLYDGWGYDQAFTVAISDENEFILGYPDQSQIPDQYCQFGETIKNEHFAFRVTMNLPMDQV